MSLVWSFGRISGHSWFYPIASLIDVTGYAYRTLRTYRKGGVEINLVNCIGVDCAAVH
jgi:hypothetical protein